MNCFVCDTGQLRGHYKNDTCDNVISVTDRNGNAITSATHIGNLNPFRYRGYYLDTETGLYYLMSRYYDPVTHRFVNADGYFQSGGDVLDANMCAYCRNNPISFVDPTGTKCSTHDPYYVPNCSFCNPDLVKHHRNHLIWLNKSCGRNDIVGVKDCGEFIYKHSSSISDGLSFSSNVLSYSRGSVYNAASYYASSAAGAAGACAISYAVTTPLNIASHATNPYLTDNQKTILIASEGVLAIGSIALTYAIANFWNPTGWVGVAVAIGCAALSTGASLAISCTSNAWSEENKKSWGGY